MFMSLGLLLFKILSVSFPRATVCVALKSLQPETNNLGVKSGKIFNCRHYNKRLVKYLLIVDTTHISPEVFGNSFHKYSVKY